MNVLVIGAHPDDETIGCGGAIARHVSKGDSVYLLVLTQIYAPEWDIRELEKRKNETFAAAKVLGIKKVFFAGLPTVKLNTIPTITMTRHIKDVIDKVKPEIVYIPPKGDINVDHDIVHRASLVACRPFLNDKLKRVLSYEIFYTTYLNFEVGNFDANVFVDITKYYGKKIEAMKKYKTELRKMPNPRSLEGIKIYSAERGLLVGCKYAEMFSLVFERI